MKHSFLIYLLGILLLNSCIDDQALVDFPTGPVEGYRPIYSESQNAQEIATEGVQPMRNVGKIILVGTTLLVNERSEGIHIIDNSNPAQPKQTGFIRISGNTELSKKGDYIYANNHEDLVTLQVSASGSVTVTDRKPNIFPELSAASGLISTIPTNSYFECIDSSKGIVIRWERTTINSPKCFK